jgi:hypothetical protein
MAWSSSAQYKLSAEYRHLQQLLEQEQLAHTAAVEQTESLRREFLSADSTKSALVPSLLPYAHIFQSYRLLTTPLR